jgi:NMD protein affecting ribosome stability and mRNA decay
MKKKCSCPDGIEMKINGIPVDPCVYKTIEIHHNVTVEVSRCIHCGHVELSWYRQDNTESRMAVDE